MQKQAAAIVAILSTGALGLAGCASDDSGPADDSNSGSISASAGASANTSDSAENSGGEASSLALGDGYCRAKEPDSDMTACFGTLTNSASTGITVESFTAPDLAGASTELHEVVDGQMRQKEGGFTIAANGSHELAPGGEHLMVLNYPDPIQAGDTLTFNLVMSDGSEFAAEFPVREQPSGEEDYAGGEHGGDHGTPHAN